MDLQARVNSVESYEDFVAFIEWLVQVYGDNPSWWENRDLPAFLEAMSAWSMRGFYRNKSETMPDPPTWKAIANMMMAATLYE